MLVVQRARGGLGDREVFEARVRAMVGGGCQRLPRALDREPDAPGAEQGRAQDPAEGVVPRPTYFSPEAKITNVITGRM